ncbi:MAG: DUF4097 family beta strand repeat protein [Candidatus Eisenbacteria bacterium]|uniref:DUF4097 family beta strand repeat protein n=1 Tax=Eiseniibacteriota bacterium TaxID=2212470 RepID=A0A933W0U0_UNCEI|nr:DUF4097 family beta strand repeat protein [Candidatus Eisenbacteria bacterium]
MKRSIRTVFAVATAAITILAAVRPAHAGGPYAERSDQTLSPAGLSGLVLDNPRGLVRIRPSTDGQLHVTAIKICRLQREEDSRRYARETAVESRAENGRWAVRVTYPKRIKAQIDFWDFFRSRSQHEMRFPLVEVQVLIEAPPAWAARVTTVSGDVDVEGLAGMLELHSTSGDLHVAATPGNVSAASVSGDLEVIRTGRCTARTVSGDVHVEDAGVLRVTTTSGDIDVRDTRDSLLLASTSGDLDVEGAPRGVTGTSSSGDIRVTAASGVVKVETRSGDIALMLDRDLRGCSARTTSGELTAELESRLDATLDLRTVSGSMDCTAPVRLTTKERTRLSAVFGRGGVPVALQTVSGDITLTSGGH